MPRGHTRHTTLVVAVTVAVVVAGWAPVAAGARPTAEGTGGQIDTVTATDTPNHAATTAPPTTANGYLAAFRNLSDDPALSTYGELEVLRSRAVAAVQVGSFDDARSRRMRGVLAVLQNFSAAYESATAGDREESLTRANDTARALDRLRTAGGRDYAALAQLALDRFYRDRGDRLRTEARTAERTPTQLQLFRLAVRAYQRGGATDRFSSTSANLERLSAEYETDLSLLNRSVTTAAAFRSSCDDRCSDPQTAVRAFGLDVFDRYVEARAAVSGARQAASLSSEHQLTARLERARGLEEWGVGTLRALTIASVALIGGYTLLFALFGAVVMARLSRWGQDAKDATLGDILPREPLEVER
ncbi:hypothetical protein [Halobaculum sp. MBLA0143]|uniref:hypothetical protein n=1 Tax=Halobaculum sp. MBLA0143 TaxID=3079933 RepID=UPI00352634A6